MKASAEYLGRVFLGFFSCEHCGADMKTGTWNGNVTHPVNACVHSGKVFSAPAMPRFTIELKEKEPK